MSETIIKNHTINCLPKNMYNAHKPCKSAHISLNEIFLSRLIVFPLRTIDYLQKKNSGIKSSFELLFRVAQEIPQT